MSLLIQHDIGWQPIHRDKPMVTPKGHAVIVPTQALAEAIVAEWVNVKGLVRRDLIPMTQYANTAIDHTATAPDAAVAGVLSHAESDLLCYRADEPRELQEHQARHWQPLLDWALNDHKIELFVFTGLIHMKQDNDGLRRLREIASQLNAFELLALAQAAGLLGSAVLALAMFQGKIDTAEAMRLSLLDELYQSEKWGEPPEMKERRDSLRRDLEELATYRALLAS